MKTLKVVTAVVAAGILGLGVLYAMPQDGTGENERSQMRKMMMQKGMDKGSMKRDVMIRLFRSIDLSDEQKEKLSSIKDEMRSEAQNKKELNQAKKEIGSYFGADGFDKEGFIANITQKFNERIKLRADYIEKMYNVLTEEQKNKLIDELKSQK